MGNKMCKKKGDVVDNVPKTPESKFDRIFARLHLKPTTWKSESHLNKKENRAKSEDRSIKKGESIFYTKPISKSSDWTDVDLEVPDDDHIHLPNPKLNLIFDNDNGTPTPPPRHKPSKPSNFKEKIEKFATKSLQALQGDKTPKTPPAVEEPLMVKKTINYGCPLCDSDEKNHNRDHHHHNNNQPKEAKNLNNKRLKNLSVVSLPNYTELKLSVAHPSVSKQNSKPEVTSSRLSLQQPNPKKLTSSQSTGKLDSYITRCRSFGSIFPQQLKKLRGQKVKPEDHVTSDDSFGPLEDWDVGLIEHYNPKDASLPRPRKPVTDQEVLAGIEDLIVQDVEEEKPQRPLRRSESLVKKINKEASEASKQNSNGKTPEDICLTPPPSPVIAVGQGKKVAKLAQRFEAPVDKVVRRSHPPVIASPESEAKRESVCEHSSLMKILQEFSVKDTLEKTATVENDSEKSSLTPSLVEFEKNLTSNGVEDFIKAEQKHSETVCS